MKQLYFFGVLACCFLSCSDDEKAVEFVEENIEYGAVIRTLDVVMSEFNINDINSRMQIAIEEQDELNGALFKALDVYVRFIDRTPDNGSFTSSEVLLETMDPERFTKGPAPERYPRSALNFSFDQMLRSTGISYESVAEKDQFLLRLDLRLNDGRSFSTGSAISDILASGTFFRSPYCYTIHIVEPMDESLYVGTYELSSIVDGAFGIPFISPIDNGVTSFTLERGHSYNTRIFKALYSIGHRGGEQPTDYEFTVVGDESIFQKNQFSSYRGKCTFRDPIILLGPARVNATLNPNDDSVFELTVMEGYLGFDGGCGFGMQESRVLFSKQ